MAKFAVKLGERNAPTRQLFNLCQIRAQDLKTDPSHVLAINVQANPGVYCLLIGSGVSRSAEIPTGWDITLELVRRIASLRGEPTDDPYKWFVNQEAKDPDYSELLAELAPTSADRQAILRGFFEPTGEELNEGVKLPQAAHHAIAKLVVDGFIKVIITTNFDQLLETAIKDAGVTPTVISTADQAKGATPLIHSKCTVIKVNGDYLDQRLLNTEAELSSYDSEINNLLDRVFDEFGIITCGWSADWDIALRQAIERAPNRRYAFYFTTRGEPGIFATKILDARGGRKVQIETADKFFSELSEQVESLSLLGNPNLASVEILKARVKKYLAEPTRAIALNDLVEDSIQSLVAQINRENFPTDLKPDSGNFLERLEQFERITRPLCQVAAIFGQWMSPPFFTTAQHLVQRLAAIPQNQNGYKVWANLELYPAGLVMYSLGINALAYGNYNLLRQVMQSAVPVPLQPETNIGLLLNAPAFGNRDYWRDLLGNNLHTPISDRIRTTLDDVIPELTPYGADRDVFFDAYEYF
ncbi:MAG: SIR2 family protein, partial [Chloroflexi bacterium]|nr:SIR2 family protein [Chloroflexota bacterium]